MARTDAQLMLAQIQSDNQGIGRFLTPSNVTLGTPQPLSQDASGKNTSITVTGIAGKGFKDATTLKYNRCSLSDLIAASSTGNTTVVVPNTGQTTMADMIASFNTAYGARLTAADLVSGASLVDSGDGYKQITLTPVSGHLLYAGAATIKYVPYATLTMPGTFTNAVAASTPYSSPLTISGGNGVYSNPVVVSGSLPPGLSLSISSNKLILSGTTGTTAFTYTFTVRVSSGDGQTVTSAAQSIAVAGGTATATFKTGVSGITYSNGSKTMAKTANGLGLVVNRASAPMSPGNRYFEIKVDREYVASGYGTSIGVCPTNNTATYLAGVTDGISYYGETGKLFFNNKYTAVSGFTPFVTGDVIGIAIQIDSSFNYQIWFSKNGVWLYGDPGTLNNALTSGKWTSAAELRVGVCQASPNDQLTFHSTAADMVYAPPTGFTASYL